MPVSSVGYVNRLKTLPLPLDAKRYGLRNRYRFTLRNYFRSHNPDKGPRKENQIEDLTNL